MNNWLQKLNEPFPDTATFRESLKGNVGVGIFVFLFLYLFQPYGMQGYDGSLLGVCLGFGGVTILLASIFDGVMYKVLKIRKDLPSWTLKKWMISVVLLITLIAIGNGYLILLVIEDARFTFDVFGQILLSTWLVGLFPIIFFGMMRQKKEDKANQIHAASLSNLPSKVPDVEQSVTIVSKNQKNQLTFVASDILYIETMDNYVVIHFLEKGELQKGMIRNTLSNIEKQLNDTDIIRCHRSYLVNTHKIQKIEGNAQGLKLTLEHLEATFVPVSRKFIPVLKTYRVS